MFVSTKISGNYVSRYGYFFLLFVLLESTRFVGRGMYLWIVLYHICRNHSKKLRLLLVGCHNVCLNYMCVSSNNKECLAVSETIKGWLRTIVVGRK